MRSPSIPSSSRTMPNGVRPSRSINNSWRCIWAFGPLGPPSETPWATSCVTKRYDWSRPPPSSPRPKRSSGTTTSSCPPVRPSQRVVGEQRALARQQLYVRLLAGLPSSMPADLDVLVQVEETPYSPLHALKAPPGLPSPRALLRLIAKLDQLQATQVL